jgi:hypothetical protein
MADGTNVYLHHDYGLIDQTIDTTVVSLRAQQQQDQFQQKLSQLVDGNAKPPLAAPSGSVPPKSGEQPQPQSQQTGGQQVQPSEEEMKRKRQEEIDNKFLDKRVLYNSINRGACYHAFSWLWCGCFEPKYKITQTYAIGEEWYWNCTWTGCCTRLTDSMAYENVDDVQRQQSCLFCLLSCCPCCPCFDDMADVILLGQDESHSGGGWRLKRLHNSTEVFNKLTKIIQDTHKDIAKKV